MKYCFERGALQWQSIFGQSSFVKLFILFTPGLIVYWNDNSNEQFTPKAQGHEAVTGLACACSSCVIFMTATVINKKKKHHDNRIKVLESTILKQCTVHVKHVLSTLKK